MAAASLVPCWSFRCSVAVAPSYIHTQRLPVTDHHGRASFRERLALVGCYLVLCVGHRGVALWSPTFWTSHGRGMTVHQEGSHCSLVKKVTHELILIVPPTDCPLPLPASWELFLFVIPSLVLPLPVYVYPSTPSAGQWYAGETKPRKYCAIASTLLIIATACLTANLLQLKAWHLPLQTVDPSRKRRIRRRRSRKSTSSGANTKPERRAKVSLGTANISSGADRCTATSIIPQNEVAERAAKRASAKSKAPAKTTQQSYEEAAEQCRRKVDQIVKECRRVNAKYRDPHFDLEFDLKFGRRDCLDSLDNERKGNNRRRYAGGRRGRDSPLKDRLVNSDKAPPPTSGTIMGLLSMVDKEKTVTADGDTKRIFRPQAVKRVIDIFDNPQFFVNGPTANDVRQGRDGDCWLMAALCTLSNKSGLIERCCIAHDVDVGVYGFVFHRDGEWFSEIIDDKAGTVGSFSAEACPMSNKLPLVVSHETRL